MLKVLGKITRAITVVTAVVIAVTQLRDALRRLKARAESSEKAHKYTGGYNPIKAEAPSA